MKIICKHCGEVEEDFNKVCESGCPKCGSHKWETGGLGE